MQPTITPAVLPPVALIYAGLPGSGKSTLIRGQPDPKTVVSADDYWVNDAGKYVFVAKDLPKAHDACLRRYLEALQRGDRLVVVDNTNLTVWQIAPYYRLAEVFGYRPQIIKVYCDPYVALARNTHDVPVERFFEMVRQYQELELPPWWNKAAVVAA
jgi:predicted kinase